MPEKSSLQKEEHFWLTLGGPIVAGKVWRQTVLGDREGNAGAPPVFLLFSL